MSKTLRLLLATWGNTGPYKVEVQQPFTLNQGEMPAPLKPPVKLTSSSLRLDNPHLQIIKTFYVVTSHNQAYFTQLGREEAQVICGLCNLLGTHALDVLQPYMVELELLPHA